MKRLALLLATLAYLATTACALLEPVNLDPWLGRHVNEAIASWGPPDDVTAGYGGMTFYTWYSYYTYTSAGSQNTNCDNNGNCYTSVQPATQNTTESRKTLTVNNEGGIVGWSSE